MHVCNTNATPPLLHNGKLHAIYRRPWGGLAFLHFHRLCYQQAVNPLPSSHLAKVDSVLGVQAFLQTSKIHTWIPSASTTSMYFVIDAGPACATCFTNTRVHTRALNMNKADDACTLMHSRAHTCARTCTHAQPSCRAPMLDHARGPGVKRGCRDKGVGSDIKMDKGVWSDIQMRTVRGCLHIGRVAAACT